MKKDNYLLNQTQCYDVYRGGEIQVLYSYHINPNVRVHYEIMNPKSYDFLDGWLISCVIFLRHYDVIQFHHNTQIY